MGYYYFLNSEREKTVLTPLGEKTTFSSLHYTLLKASFPYVSVS